MESYLAAGGPVPCGCRARYHLRRFCSGSQNPRILSRVLRTIQGSKFLQQPGAAMPACSPLSQGSPAPPGRRVGAHSMRFPTK